MIRSTVATMALVLLLAGCGDKPAAPEGAGEHAGEEHGNGESHEAGEESAGKDELLVALRAGRGMTAHAAARMEDALAVGKVRLARTKQPLLESEEKLFALPEVIGELRQELRALAGTGGRFSVIEAKTHLGLGRDLTIEILEYFDAARFTRRVGNARQLTAAAHC